jgi:hypothetical protein
VDHPAAGEPVALRLVALGGIDGLLIPVHVEMIDREDGNGLREALAERR